jgi:hypothetical protein
MVVVAVGALYLVAPVMYEDGSAWARFERRGKGKKRRESQSTQASTG